MIQNKLDKAEDIPEIFEVVKEIVKKSTGLEQTGIMLGLNSFGTHPRQVLGAFYSPNSNMIVINKTITDRIQVRNPKLYKSYLFHILLHEYLHSIGIHNEDQVRQITYLISKKYFGKEHDVTKIAQDFNTIIKQIIYPFDEPQEDLEFVHGFNKSELNYIG